MTWLRSALVLFLFFGSMAHAASKGGFGLNAGLGVPYMGQGGINYQFSDRFGLSAGYNLLDLTQGDAGVKVSMPEIMFSYHPFAGSYFIAAGVGQEKLEATGTAANLAKIKIEVEAMTTIIKTGWMWGLSDGGFWFGIDVAYIIPSGAKTTTEATGVPLTDETLLDAIDAAEKFGDSSYINITFARLGWIF